MHDDSRLDLAVPYRTRQRDKIGHGRVLEVMHRERAQLIAQAERAALGWLRYYVLELLRWYGEVRR